MKFKEEDVIGIFNPETGKVIIKGQYCIDTIVSELEIDMPDNAMIILTQPDFAGVIWQSITVQDWINFVMIK